MNLNFRFFSPLHVSLLSINVFGKQILDALDSSLSMSMDSLMDFEHFQKLRI